MGSGTKIAVGVLGVLTLMLGGLVWLRVNTESPDAAITTLQTTADSPQSAAANPPIVVYRISSESLTTSSESPALPPPDAAILPLSPDPPAPRLDPIPDRDAESTPLQRLFHPLRLAREPLANWR